MADQKKRVADQKKRWKEKSARYVATLVYVDEPQVVLLDHGDDSKIVAVAIEKEGFEYPVLGAEISHTQWIRYRRQFVDLRYLFDWPRWKKWYLFDLNQMSDDNKIPLSLANIADYRNQKYLPARGFFSEKHTEVSQEDVHVNLAIQKYKIDGAWEPLDLSVFFARIYDLYAFFVGINKFGSAKTSTVKKRDFLDAIMLHPLRGGASYVNLYADLREFLEFEERLTMSKIVKQSPGYFDIEGKADTLRDVSAAYLNFVEHYDELKKQYDVLHKFLSQMGLLKDPDRFEPKGPVADQIRDYSQAYATLIGLDYAIVHRVGGQNGLKTAKILLAHWRRLDRYFQFFAEGRVTLSRDGSGLPVANSPSIAAKPDA